MSDLRNLIDRALNPSVHGADSDHCPACFGACAAFPGEWTEDAEELAAALAKAIESLLNKIEDALGDAWDQGNGVGLDGWIGPGRGAGEVDPEAIRARERDVAHARAYLLGEEMKG